MYGIVSYVGGGDEEPVMRGGVAPVTRQEAQTPEQTDAVIRLPRASERLLPILVAMTSVV
jgi:hypothetical protein